MGADEPTAAGGRHGALDGGESQSELVGEDLGEQAGEEPGADPIRVAADALAAPPDDGPDDHVAGRLVPVGRHATDDRVVIRVAGRVDLTFEQRADEGVEGEVDRVDRLEDHEGVAGDRAQVVMRVEPLHRLGRMADDRRRLAVFDRQRRDDFDVRPGQSGKHPWQFGQCARTRLHPDALAALACVIELEDVVLGDALFGHRRFRKRHGVGGLGVLSA